MARPRRGRAAPCDSPGAQAHEAPPQAPGAPLAGAPEIAVEASADGGALNEEHVVETARWYLPEARLRHEGGMEPENVRTLRARGDSMEPVAHDGDRLLVDTSRRTPATGEMAVLWDGGGLVVKRVEIVPRTDPVRLRLVSANPAYPPYTCLADEAHMVGTVIWVAQDGVSNTITSRAVDEFGWEAFGPCVDAVLTDRGRRRKLGTGHEDELKMTSSGNSFVMTAAEPAGPLTKSSRRRTRWSVAGKTVTRPWTRLRSPLRWLRTYQDRCCRVGKSRAPTIRLRIQETTPDPSGIAVHAERQLAVQSGSASVMRFGWSDAIDVLGGRCVHALVE